jgi:hypothetical protein
LTPVYQGIGDKDLGANVNNLGAAIQGLAQVVGGPAVPQAIEGLHLLTGAIHRLTGLAASNPTAAKSMLGAVFGPSLFMGAWDAAKDQAMALWHHLPSMSGTQAAGAVHGRDPRSPQSGTLAYTPPSAPVSVTAPLSGNATVKTGPITLNVSGSAIVAALATEIGAKIHGLFRGMGAAGTNGDSGFDGREHPAMPDHFHGGGH